MKPHRAAVLVLLAACLAPRAVAQEDNQLDADIRMFTVMAAINAAGYDDGAASRSDSLVRQAVRQHLSGFDGESKALLQNAYQQFKLDDPSENLSQFVSYALLCEPPPAFALRAELPTDLPPDVRRLRALAPILQQFYFEADIEGLWQRYQSAYEQELDRVQRTVVPVLFRTAGYLRLSTQGREFRGFKIWVDLLGAPNAVNTRLYGGNVQLVLHSSEKIQIEEIRQAFLMHMLDRLAVRNREEIGSKEVLSRFALFAPALDEAYKTDFELLVTKSLVKAVEARLDRRPADETQQKVTEALREGYILTPYFYEKLADFEADTRDINRFYPELIRGIDVKREAARLQETTFVERPSKPRAEPRRPKLSETDKLLQRAEFLLREDMLDEAREAFEDAHEKAEGKSAQAAYGLARVAISEADPDLAREFFAEAARLAVDDPQIRGMSYVYIGRIEDIVGNREQAVENYRLALEAQGASERVRKFAEQGLAQPFSRPGSEEDRDN